MRNNTCLVSTVPVKPGTPGPGGVRHYVAFRPEYIVVPERMYSVTGR